MQPFTTLRVCIPVTADPPVLRRGRQGRVLFISADANLRASVTRVLEYEGYRVDAVPHSGHALLLSRTKAFDVVVAELSGPDLSGPTLVEQLRRHCPAVAAVYIGNPGTPEGVNGLLVRPFTRDDLLERIEAAISAVVV